MASTNEIFLQAISIVKQAGTIIRDRIFDAQPTLLKDKFNFATPVDYEVQEFIIGKLAQIVPDSAFLAEEDHFDRYDISQPLWVLDPIDGTTNFIHGYPHVAISLALVRHNKILFGIVYNPIAKELFYSQVGNGSYLNDQRIMISSNKTLDNCIIGFGLPYNRRKSDFLFQKAQQVFSRCQDIKRKGPASLDIAYVSCGRLDGYFELDLHPWDFVAGILILEEAGGRITDWSGLPLSIDRSNNIIASNKYIHGSLINILNSKHVTELPRLPNH